MKLSRRDFIKFLGTSAAAAGLGSKISLKPSDRQSGESEALRMPDIDLSAGRPSDPRDHSTKKNPPKIFTTAPNSSPNILYFQVDNLGIGELGCYGGGILRGAVTRKIDQFAKQGIQLLNFAPEAQCTPSRSALMTGRYSIRSGCHTIPFAGEEGGIVAWERSIADILSEAGYACACYGKWHIGESDGRWPTDHGFDEWYGPIRSYDECLWPTCPEYDPTRDIKSHVLEGSKGKGVNIDIDILTEEVRREIDLEYLKRAEAFIRKNVDEKIPFYIYFNHSLMHMPTIPRKEYEGKSGSGDWADSLLELDGDFGRLLDMVEELGINDQTIVIFAGDNGAEETEPWRGSSGYWEGSYFTGMEGSLRTPGIVRWPGHVSTGQQSNEIVHITDMFTTLLGWAGSNIPKDRVIDGMDQRAFFEGKTEQSAREGFIFWNGPQEYGVKWRDFKGVRVDQKYMWDPALNYPIPRIYNLKLDPKERENRTVYYGWVAGHIGRIMQEFAESVKREPLIPAGAPLDYNPYKAEKSS